MCPTGTHQYTYDGANRLTNISGGSVTYAYFGQLRIKKTTASGTTIYIYSGGKPIAEYSAAAAVTNPSQEYIYAGSQLLASVAGSSTTYYHPDHLSNRAETDSAGNVLRRLGNFPYGESWYDSTPSEKRQFTTYERDLGTGETGLDYAQFRYFSSKQGRFMTADLLGGDNTIPQSMNRYSYVLGDPINLFDPAGLCGVVTVTTIEYDLDKKEKSRHTTVTDEGSCLGGGVGTVGGGGGGLPGPPQGGGGGGIPKAKKHAKDLLNILDCVNFLKNLLTNLKQLPDLNTFSQRFDALSVVPTPASDPYVKGGGRKATAHVDPYIYPGSPANTVVHVDNPAAPDLAGTLLHEELHTYPYGFDDLDLAHAIGQMTNVTDRTQANENKASQKFSEEMNKHCHD
jgi:RHS repeat-associated protein